MNGKKTKNVGFVALQRKLYRNVYSIKVVYAGIVVPIAKVPIFSTSVD